MAHPCWWTEKVTYTHTHSHPWAKGGPQPGWVRPLLLSHSVYWPLLSFLILLILRLNNRLCIYGGGTEEREMLPQLTVCIVTFLWWPQLHTWTQDLGNPHPQIFWCQIPLAGASLGYIPKLQLCFCWAPYHFGVIFMACFLDHPLHSGSLMHTIFTMGFILFLEQPLHHGQVFHQSI